MARNKRKSYDALTADDAHGIPCSECGCCHSYVIRTEKIGATIRRTRQCRNCGARYCTTESA